MILVTGGTGFIGNALVKRLLFERTLGGVVMAVRHLNGSIPRKVRPVLVGDMSETTDWSGALKGVDVVVHCAARVHVMREINPDPLGVFRSLNVQATQNLAQQAAHLGVRRFVYVSSLKVHGENTPPGRPFFVTDMSTPIDAYGISKAEAEAALKQIARETGMEVVIIRPPLVYGHGVKGNFATILRWLQRGTPLPLGSVTENRRSLVAIDNLVDLLVTCMDHPAAANETFLVSDGEDLSTTDLLRRIGVVMGKPARLWPVAPELLQAAAKLLGKGNMAQRLLGNLQVDISHTCQTLGWKPPIGVEEGLRRAVKGFVQ